MTTSRVAAAALCAAALLAVPASASSDKPVTEKQTVTVKATIDAIDHDARMVTLKDKDGNYETLYAGPEIKRFDELKVGDTVTFKATESMVYQVRKPGEPAPASGSEEPALVRGTGAKPSGTLTHQETATVTVKSIDPKVPAITVTTEDGRSMSFSLESGKLLKGLNPGDRVVITYTVALAISVE